MFSIIRYALVTLFISTPIVTYASMHVLPTIDFQTKKEIISQDEKMIVQDHSCQETSKCKKD